MQNNQPRYKFYATLLDAFRWYRASESESALQEFIDKINRVEIVDEKALERMNKGTALNNLVDKQVKNHVFCEADKISSIVDNTEFTFDAKIVNELGDRLELSIPQHYIECTIDVNGVEVLLYGYIDYLRLNRCIDLKTTSKYELGKYKDNMQMHLYPVSLKEKGIDVDEFEFLVTDFKEVYSEVYPINIDNSLNILSNECGLLIEFLELKKDLITNKKIFGLE